MTLWNGIAVYECLVSRLQQTPHLVCMAYITGVSLSGIYLGTYHKHGKDGLGLPGRALSGGHGGLGIKWESESSGTLGGIRLEGLLRKWDKNMMDWVDGVGAAYAWAELGTSASGRLVERLCLCIACMLHFQSLAVSVVCEEKRVWWVSLVALERREPERAER
jgi:hypothetical protein